MKLIMKVFILGMLILTSVSMVSALGITPGRTTVNFEAGSSTAIEVTVINSDHEDMQLVVLVQGELNESISLPEVSYVMAANEQEKKITYKFNAPKDLTPGTHEAEVVIIKLPTKTTSGASFVGAATGVATQLRVLVPYPGRYAEATLEVGTSDEGTVGFVLAALNKGKLDLEKVRASIDIYTALNERIATLSTNEIALRSGEKGELVTYWDANVSAGNYRAVATLIYDEGTTSTEKVFSVGKRVLELREAKADNFNLGDIAKLELLVENVWSEPITGAYAEMLVYGANKDILAQFKSPTYDLSPLSKTVMVLFWDTKGIKEGSYDASVFLRFGQQSAQQDLQFKVSQSELEIIGLGYVISSQKGDTSGGNSLVIILVTIIGILVAVNLLWFLYLRKRINRATLPPHKR